MVAGLCSRSSFLTRVSYLRGTGLRKVPWFLILSIEEHPENAIATETRARIPLGPFHIEAD